MKVTGNSLELPGKLLFFVISPPEGGEMGVYMKVPYPLNSEIDYLFMNQSTVFRAIQF
jgi:hypothetical protein